MTSEPSTDVYAAAHDGPHRYGRRALDEITELCRTANYARRHLEVTVLHHAGLSWSSYDILHLTVMHRPVDTGVVAALASVSKGTVTRSAATLIKRDLLRRAVPATDRRRSLLTPTPAGWALNQQLRAQLVSELERLLHDRPSTPAAGVEQIRIMARAPNIVAVANELRVP